MGRLIRITQTTSPPNTNSAITGIAATRAIPSQIDCPWSDADVESFELVLDKGDSDAEGEGDADSVGLTETAADGAADGCSVATAGGVPPAPELPWLPPAGPPAGGAVTLTLAFSAADTFPAASLAHAYKVLLPPLANVYETGADADQPAAPADGAPADSVSM